VYIYVCIHTVSVIEKYHFLNKIVSQFSLVFIIYLFLLSPTVHKEFPAGMSALLRFVSLKIYVCIAMNGEVRQTHAYTVA
jgi:hypothetical protein